MDFYELTNEDIPLEEQPELVLSVETEELGINAGLQDRVVQVYGGTVFMDFNRSTMDALGHGIYRGIDSSLLPNLFVVYMEGSGKDSGKMHNEVRFRFNQGDRVIMDSMIRFADYAQEAKQALEKRDLKRFGMLMNANFDLRREVYGDSAIGERNLQMIEIARNLGAPVKFPGSGGAVIGIYEDENQYRKLEQAYLSQGYIFAGVSVEE
jgi:glucuronokinase